MCFQITFIAILFYTCTQVVHTGNIKFSKFNADAESFKIVFGISLETCKRECMEKQICNSAVYEIKSHKCKLIATNASQHEDGAKKGSVLIYGTFDRQKMDLKCGDRCNAGKSCIQTDGAEYTCKITECNALYGPRILGNVFDVGNTLMSSDRKSTLTCTENGTWSTNLETTTDCSDVQGGSGLFWQPDLLITVFCDMVTDGGKWLVFQRRVDGSIDFFRNWDSYVFGFGNVAGEFWLGLKYIYNILSSESYELRVDMRDFSDAKRFAVYSTFSLNGPEDDYRLFVYGYRGNAGDSMSPHNNMRFSTFDKDNDIYARTNCAEWYKGAWWYKDCHQANLNGLYSPTGTNIDHTTIQWIRFTGNERSLKYTAMKMRRKGLLQL